MGRGVFGTEMIGYRCRDRLLQMGPKSFPLGFARAFHEPFWHFWWSPLGMQIEDAPPHLGG